jgi:hypothetical protein
MPTGYASGGIARGKQMAMLAEGDYNTEAVVPLPDGRTIPVTMTGDSAGADDIRALTALVEQVVMNNSRAADSGQGDIVIMVDGREIGRVAADRLDRGDREIVKAVIKRARA